MIKKLLFIVLLLLCSCTGKSHVPDGFSHVEDNIYVDKNGNEFIWVDVTELVRYDFYNKQEVKANEAVERVFYGEERKESVIYNTEYDFNAFSDSVKKYGGFYISRYLISKDDNGNLISKSGKEPITFITRDDALKLALSYSSDKNVVSTLPLSYAYDAIFLNDIHNYESAGTYSEWSSEYSSNAYYEYTEDCVSRGSNSSSDNIDISRRNFNSNDAANEFTSFRILLYMR